MKQFTFIFVMVMFSFTIVFSQNTNSKKATPAKTSASQASTAKKDAAKDATLHYSFSSGRLTNCMGNKWNTQLEDVKLKNGTIVTRKGVIKYKNGTFGQLKDGECIDMAGQITDHKEAHAAMAKM